jgi:hypothetical protein
MKIGNLVMASEATGDGLPWITKVGIIIGFGKPGSGGKEFVHVIIDGCIEVFLASHVEVVK